MFEIINHKLFKMKNILVSIVLLFTTYSFTQEITGVTKTGDKYSLMIRESNEGYFKNDFTTINQIFADDGSYTINGDNFTKNQIIEGFAMHHNLYRSVWVYRITLRKNPFRKRIQFNGFIVSNLSVE